MVVKGVSKRVVVVKPRTHEIFEEAIFIVRGDKSNEGRTPEDILREAYRVAEGYTGRPARRTLLQRIPAPLYAVMGAASVGVAWVVSLL